MVAIERDEDGPYVVKKKKENRGGAKFPKLKPATARAKTIDELMKNMREVIGRCLGRN